MQCQSKSGGCAGTANGSCWPYVTWSSYAVVRGYYNAYDCAAGRFFEALSGGHNGADALSVRIF